MAHGGAWEGKDKVGEGKDKVDWRSGVQDIQAMKSVKFSFESASPLLHRQPTYCHLTIDPFWVNRALSDHQ